MRRTFRHLLIALAVLFGQQATQLHALAHLRHELAGAQGGSKGPLPMGHPAAQCLAYHAADIALPGIAPAMDLWSATPPTFTPFTLPLPLPPRIEFDSRAPPVLS